MHLITIFTCYFFVSGVENPALPAKLPLLWCRKWDATCKRESTFFFNLNVNNYSKILTKDIVRSEIYH